MATEGLFARRLAPDALGHKVVHLLLPRLPHEVAPQHLPCEAVLEDLAACGLCLEQLSSLDLRVHQLHALLLQVLLAVHVLRHADADDSQREAPVDDELAPDAHENRSAQLEGIDLAQLRHGP